MQIDKESSTAHEAAKYRREHETKEYFMKIINLSISSLDEIGAIADKEPIRLEFMGACFANIFWQQNRLSRISDSSVVPGRYGCRVRIRNNKLEASWFINSFLDEEDMSRRKNKRDHVRSKHIRKGLGYRYRRNSFSKAQDWEKPLIDAVEDSFALIRELKHEMVLLKNKVNLCRDRFKKLQQQYVELEGQYNANN